MWQDKLKEIIYLLEQSQVNEIDVTFWGRRFRVVKSPSTVVGNGVPQTTAAAPVTPASGPTSTPPAETTPTETGEPVLSPMPGTFYRAPAPDADPFVSEGDRVAKGDTLCIIEAMKIMNEIEAEVGGVVRKILVENATPVEYNQPLFLIDPNG
ncbi:MAG: acetyl-CoA carboxylase biotin carboxyl carrier protein [Candidatus Neomarinimicrobiota bacterium]|nr:MAG: acetyl-CoA carboxylase biotin carboxyl carrier protein [Candidatus Neomarinimicrobiota bacterium]